MKGCLNMNIEKDLIKGIEKRMKKFNGDTDRVILDYSKLRRLTYEDAHALYQEAKRYGGYTFNTKAMDVEKHIKRAVKKGKGDKHVSKRDLRDLVELIG